MTCNGNNKECPNEVKWMHRVYLHGVFVGIIHSCDEHVHCKECKPYNESNKKVNNKSS